MIPRRVLLATGVTMVAAWWAMRRRPFRVAVSGTSMAPVLLPDEYLVAVAPRRLRRGDLVVVGHPDRPGFEMVKRLAGLPGDRVDRSLLAADEHWVVGTGDASTDSRTFGPVSALSIRGVVKLRYWPLERVRAFR